MNPKVLVLMATYNGKEYLNKQLDSILSQVGVNVHVLVRDDGSIDGTLEILNEYTHTGVVKVIKAKIDDKHGAMNNFYNLLRIAQTEYSNDYDYFALSDQDDVWYKNKLEVLINDIKEKSTKPQLVYCNYEVIDQKGGVVVQNVDEQIGLFPTDPRTLLFTNSFAWGHSILFNKVLFKEISFKQDILESNFPHDAYLAKFAVLSGGLNYEPSVLVSYRRHTENVSNIWYRFSFKHVLSQFRKEGKIYANVVNLTLMTMELNNASSFVDKKMINEVTNVIERGGIKSLCYFYKNQVGRKQLSRTIALYYIYFFKLYRLFLNERKKLVVK